MPKFKETSSESNLDKKDHTPKGDPINFDSFLNDENLNGNIIVGDVKVKNGDFIRGNKIEIENSSNIVINTNPPDPNIFLLEQTYLKWIISRCNRLPLGVVNPKYISTNGDPRIPLTDIFVSLYMERFGTESKLPFLGASFSNNEEKDKSEITKPESIVEDQSKKSVFSIITGEPALKRCFVIVGDPGSGKTTVINRICVGLAFSYLNGLSPDKVLENWLDETPRIPIRIILRDFIYWMSGNDKNWDIRSLWEFIIDQLQNLGISEYFKELHLKILAGKAIIMFDGLDEVPEILDRRTNLIELLTAFSDTSGSSIIIVTCRINAYKEASWKLPSFDDFLILPFNQCQIDLFIEKWYRTAGKTEGWSDEIIIDRTKSLQRASCLSHLVPLSSQPLLLTLMATLHAARGTLPDDRADLYSDCVRLLLDDWQKTKLIPGQKTLLETLDLPVGKLERILSQIAFNAQIRQYKDSKKDVTTSEISYFELLENLASALGDSYDRAKILVEYIERRAGLLLAKGNKTYSFPHRTFQEYLSACYLLESDEFPYNLSELTKEDPYWWREVVLLAVGRARPVFGQAVALINALVPGDWDISYPINDWYISLLACEAAAEIHLQERALSSRAYKKTLDRLHGWLKAIIEHEGLSQLEKLTAGEFIPILDFERSGAGLDGHDLPEINLCKIPSGYFFMGSTDSDKDAFISEKPLQRFQLPEFQISEFPITNIQYLSFINNVKGGWAGKGFNLRYSHHPAVNITWHEARAFCDWLTLEWYKISKIKINEVVRLPTEAEWEKAARGDTKIVYPWGEKWHDGFANTWESKIRGTSPVGIFLNGASYYGCSDIAGNVWEWTQSEFDKYPYNLSKDIESIYSDVARVVRGGSWNSSKRDVRVTCRDWINPSNKEDFLGFRIVVATEK